MAALAALRARAGEAASEDWLCIAHGEHWVSCGQESQLGRRPTAGGPEGGR